MKYEIIDNFLDIKKFQSIVNKIDDSKFPWYLQQGKKINMTTNNECFMFTHSLIENYNFLYDNAKDLVDPIILKLKNIKKINLEMYRGKINLFFKMNKNIKYGFHKDMENESMNNYNTVIFYLNSNNGGTEFENGTFVKSVKNRLLIVSENPIHQSVGQTDSLKRTLININYRRI